MFPKSLAKHFSSLTDVRTVPLPWEGLDTIFLQVLRSGAPEATAWRESHEGRNPVVDSLVKTSLKASISEQMAAEDEGSTRGRAGWRAQRKATRAQSTRRNMDRVEAIVDRAVDQVPLADLKANDDLNGEKPYVAKVVTKGWLGVAEDGAPVEATLSNKLHFFGWLGVLVVLAGVEHFLTEEQFRTVDPESELGQAIASGAALVEHFDGNPRDAEGNLVWVEEGMKYGPGPIGDCLTEFALDTSEEGEAYKVRFSTKAVADLVASPAGSTST
jgi:hypothetical protein